MAEYKNMIGTEFPNYVTKQLEARKDLVKKNNRTNRDLLWLTNRTGWYKISSGALIGGKNDLARKNILQGGTVEDAGGGEPAAAGACRPRLRGARPGEAHHQVLQACNYILKDFHTVVVAPTVSIYWI